MVIRTIKTNVAEADTIMDNKLSFIFRSDKERYAPCDVIQFLCMKDKRSITHRINDKSFVVTVVLDSMTAPILDGYQIVGIRKVAGV